MENPQHHQDLDFYQKKQKRKKLLRLCLFQGFKDSIYHFFKSNQICINQRFLIIRANLYNLEVKELKYTFPPSIGIYLSTLIPVLRKKDSAWLDQVLLNLHDQIH